MQQHEPERKYAERVFVLAELAAFTGGKSRPTIYKWIRAGMFPRPVRIGPNTVAWRESDLIAWQEGHFAANHAPLVTPAIRKANAVRRASRKQAALAGQRSTHPRHE